MSSVSSFLSERWYPGGSFKKGRRFLKTIKAGFTKSSSYLEKYFTVKVLNMELIRPSCLKLMISYRLIPTTASNPKLPTSNYVLSRSSHSSAFAGSSLKLSHFYNAISPLSHPFVMNTAISIVDVYTAI
ncbi:hypothetical protein CsSME_00047922 [Camellia sinensis var. sinensis]